MRKMQDLEQAKETLKGRNLSLVVVKEGKTLFHSTSSGIDGLLEAIESLDEGLSGSAVADRVVGRAAALLLAFSHIKEAYAATLSREGLNVLEKNNIRVEHGALVPTILDREGKHICPFERFSSTIESPGKAYEQLKAFARTLRRGK